MEKRNDAKKEYMERDKESLKEARKQAKHDKVAREMLEQNKSDAQTGEKAPRQKNAPPFPRIPSAETIADHIVKLRRRP